MALTRRFRDLVQQRVANEPAFAASLLREGIDAIASDVALCVSFGKPLLRLPRVVWSQLAFAPELHAVGVGAASGIEFNYAAAFELGGDPQHAAGQLGEIVRDIKDGLGEGAEANAGPLHVAGNDP